MASPTQPENIQLAGSFDAAESHAAASIGEGVKTEFAAGVFQEDSLESTSSFVTAEATVGKFGSSFGGRTPEHSPPGRHTFLPCPTKLPSSGSTAPAPPHSAEAFRCLDLPFNAVPVSGWPAETFRGIDLPLNKEVMVEDVNLDINTGTRQGAGPCPSTASASSSPTFRRNEEQVKFSPLGHQMLPPISEDGPSAEWAARVSKDIEELSKRHQGESDDGDSSPISPLRGGLVRLSEMQDVVALITSVMQHVVKMERQMSTQIDLKMSSINQSVDCRLKDLGSCLADALDMERTLRSQEITELRAAVGVTWPYGSSTKVDAASSTTSQPHGSPSPRGHGPPVEEGNAVAQTARQEWESLSIGLTGLKSQLVNDLSEQHARVALDLAERHIEVSRALDLRAEELTDMQKLLSKNLRRGAAAGHDGLVPPNKMTETHAAVYPTSLVAETVARPPVMRQASAPLLSGIVGPASVAGLAWPSAPLIATFRPAPRLPMHPVTVLSGFMPSKEGAASSTALKGRRPSSTSADLLQHPTLKL